MMVLWMEVVIVDGQRIIFHLLNVETGQKDL